MGLFLSVLGAHLLLLFQLWVYYLAVMHLKKINDTVGLPKKIKVPAGIALAIGYITDAYLNIVLLTLITLRLPKELTISSRLKRYNKEEGTWGKKVAQWFEPFLDPFDPRGEHI